MFAKDNINMMFRTKKSKEYYDLTIEILVKKYPKNTNGQKICSLKNKLQ